MLITMRQLRRIIRESIEDMLMGWTSEDRYDKHTDLLYTVRYADAPAGSGGFEEKNSMYLIRLKDDMELTPEILVDFWYHENKYDEGKIKKYVPVKAEVLERGRAKTGITWDLEPALSGR